MNNSNTVLSKWEKISKGSKGWHMFVRASLLNAVPMMLLLIFMLEFMNGYRHDNLGLFLLVATGKIILTYLCGVYAGKLEWDFLKKMAEKKFQKKKNIRNSYIYIYGVWMFGVNFTISLIEPAFEDISLTLIKIIILPLAGVMFGALMMWMYNSNLDKYVDKKI